MSNTSDSIKTSIRPDYKPCSNICYICKNIGKKKSKKFDTLYSLKYHLTTAHNTDDEICAGVTRKQILHTAQAISQALEWGMLVDFPKVKL